MHKSFDTDTSPAAATPPGGVRGAAEVRLSEHPTAGLGPVAQGPTFAPFPSVGTEEFPRAIRDAGPGQSNVGASAPLRSADHYRSPPSRLPALITALVVLVVAAVVAGASMVAHRNDLAVRPAAATAHPTAPSPTRPDTIAVDNAKGAGELVVLAHRWVTYGGEPPTSGTYLQVKVQLLCTRGAIDYAPYHFQVIDASGRIFEITEVGATGKILEAGTIRAGERVSGYVAFDMVRGDVTLLMIDEGTDSITALSISD
jgi:hypothetical protein